MNAEQIAKLSDAELRQFIEGAAGEITIAEEDGQYAAWVHFRTEVTLPDGRRRLSWHQPSGHGSSLREAMEFLGRAIAREHAD